MSLQRKEIEDRFNALNEKESTSPYRSYLSVCEELDLLQSQISQVKHQHKRGFTFWQHIKAFFGFKISDEYSRVKMLAKRIDAFAEPYVKQRDQFYRPTLNGILGLFYDLGWFDLKDKCLEYVNEQLNNPKIRLKFDAYHLMGRQRYTGDALNGMHAPVAATLLNDELKQFFEEVNFIDAPRDSVATATHQLDRLVDYANQSIFLREIKKFKSEAEYEAMTHQVSRQVMDDIDRLDIGESILLPSGYKSEEGNHAICYKIEKRENEQLRVIYYNTGDGVSEQITKGETGFWSQLKQLYQLYWNTTHELYFDISEEDFESETLGLILDANLEVYNTRDEAVAAMLRPLEGQKVATGQTFSTQTNGTCAESCLLAFLSCNLPELKSDRYGKTSVYDYFINYLTTRSKQHLETIEAQGSSGEDDYVNTLKANTRDQQLQGYELIHDLLQTADETTEACDATLRHIPDSKGDKDGRYYQKFQAAKKAHEESLQTAPSQSEMQRTEEPSGFFATLMAGIFGRPDSQPAAGAPDHAKKQQQNLDKLHMLRMQRAVYGS